MPWKTTPLLSCISLSQRDQAKFYQDWGPDLCESRRRAHSPIGVSFECPYQHPPWFPVSIGMPAPKIHQLTSPLCANEPSIFVDGDLAESIKRSASDRLGDWCHRFEPGLLQGFSRHGASIGLCLETFVQCTILSYPGQPPPPILLMMNRSKTQLVLLDSG